MKLRSFIRAGSGCATYLVASDATGDAAVIDPVADVRAPLALAEEEGLTITHVIDTHLHADHVSGARRLAAAAGARLFLPALADLQYDAERLHDGERLRLGEVELEILHLPGHRPEQVALLARDLSRGPDPWCLFSADTLLVGDLARPDLAQAGEDGARVTFARTLPRLLALADHVEVYPGHVAGST